MAPKKLPPKLPAAAFAPQPVETRRIHPKELLDAHIHIFYDDSIHPRLTAHPDEHPFRSGCDIASYSKWVNLAMKGKPKTKYLGYVWVECVASKDDEDLDGSKGGWDATIAEVDAVFKGGLSTPEAPLLAVAPWAPIQAGADAVAAFLARVEALNSFTDFSTANGFTTSPVRSIRYLLQSSPEGFMVAPKFIESLKYLGERGLSFEMTLDVGGSGEAAKERERWQLEEAIECITKVRENTEKPGIIVLDHFSKPDLVSDPSSLAASPSHAKYITQLFTLALFPDVYLKLSHFLNLFDPQLVKDGLAEYRARQAARKHAASVSGKAPVAVNAEEKTKSEKAGVSPTAELKKRIKLYLEPALEAFGEDRIFVASDWPMFRGVLSPHQDPKAEKDDTYEADAWFYGFSIYREAFNELGIDGEGIDKVFAGNAKKVYGLE